MLTLPSLAGVPGMYNTPAKDGGQLCAQYALAVAGKGPLAPLKIPPAAAAASTLLARDLSAWADRMSDKLRYLKLKVHLSIGSVPDSEEQDATAALFLVSKESNVIGSVWQLEHRWRALERLAPGLAETALEAITFNSYHGAIPAYTPREALALASWVIWRGEEDESELIAELKQEGGKPEDYEDIFTRAKFDRAIPTNVSDPAKRWTQNQLEQRAAKSGKVAEIARLVLEVREKIARVPRKTWFHRHDASSGEDAVQFAYAIRWNGRDPMFWIFDDWANMQSQEGFHEVLGWVTSEGPHDFKQVLAALELRIESQAAIERLLPFIATKVSR